MKLWLLTLMVSNLLIGAEVLRVGTDLRLVAISHDITRRWNLNDRVCVLKSEKEIDCGVVIRIKENYSIVKLKTGSSQISRGDKVISEVRSQKPATLIPPEAIQPETVENSALFHLLSVGGSLGPGLFYPYLHFQRILDPEIAVGIMPSYLNVKASTKTLSSISLLITANYYPKEFFKELFVTAAAGLAFLSTSSGTVEQQAASFQSLLTVGYHLNTSLGVVLGFSGGIQYLHDPNFSGLTLNGMGLKPIAIVEAGVNF